MALKLLAKIIWQTFEWVVLCGGVLGLASGLLLTFNSPLFFRINTRMSRWFSTRRAMQRMEAPIEVERAIYRRHRLVGALILGGALYTLYVVTLSVKEPAMTLALSRFFSADVALWLGKSVRIFLIVANVAAALIAAVVIVRPSALKPLEAWANREYSGRRFARALEVPVGGPDPLFEAHPKPLGVVLCAASVFILVSVGYARLKGI
ncbi:MAG TPA: hypothetical protein VEU32_05105 [Burkholderiales bacterium]|nr:hypothetical protein [Burkholderiales bacterium]